MLESLSQIAHQKQELENKMHIEESKQSLKNSINQFKISSNNDVVLKQMADQTLRVFKLVHRRTLATDPEYVKNDLN